MSAAIEPHQVTVSCVFDQNPTYRSEAVLLYASLLKFGGALVDARRRAYSVGPVDVETARQLERLGVEVVETTSPISDFPLANKLRMFEQREPDERLLVALDTDVVFVGDITDWLQDAAVAAKPVDHDPISSKQWAALFQNFEIEPPRDRYRTHFRNWLTQPYFNSGVIFFPTAELRGFADVWKDLITRSRREMDSIDPDLGNFGYFAEQWSFALAIQRLGLPYTPLPVELNFPTHNRVHKTYQRCDPLLFHHHHRIDESGLVPTGLSYPDRAIRKFNREMGDFCSVVVGQIQSQAPRTAVSAAT